MSLPEAFYSLYQDLNISTVKQLDRVYTDDIRFADPVSEHHGINAVKDYFNALLINCSACSFTIDSVTEGSAHTYVRWTMCYCHPRINRHKTVEITGLSELVLRGERISQQTDYYDLGAMLYEHLPVIGPLIRWIKRRMSQ